MYIRKNKDKDKEGGEMSEKLYLHSVNIKREGC